MSSIYKNETNNINRSPRKKLKFQTQKASPTQFENIRQFLSNVNQPNEIKVFDKKKTVHGSALNNSNTKHGGSITGLLTFSPRQQTVHSLHRTKSSNKSLFNPLKVKNENILIKSQSKKLAHFIKNEMHKNDSHNESFNNSMKSDCKIPRLNSVSSNKIHHDQIISHRAKKSEICATEQPDFIERSHTAINIGLHNNELFINKSISNEKIIDNSNFNLLPKEFHLITHLTHQKPSDIINNSPKHLLSESHKAKRVIKIIDKIHDSENSDDSEEEISDKRCVIHPNSKFLYFYELLIIIFLFHIFIFDPFLIAFYDDDPIYFHIMAIFIDIVFLIDLFIHFFIAYYDFDENLITSNKEIALNYLLTSFVFDLLTAIPFSLISFNTDTTTLNNYRLIRIGKISRITKLARLTKVVKLLKFFGKNDSQSAGSNLAKIKFIEDMNINDTFKRFIKFFIYFLLFNHLSTCIWVFMASFDNPNWLTTSRLVDIPISNIYVASMYYNFSTIFTIGYGDIRASNMIERIYNIFLMFVGVLVYSFAITSISNLVAQSDDRQQKYNYNMDILNDICSKYRVDDGLFCKLKKFFKYDFKINRINKKQVLNDLPFHLKNSMILQIYNNTLKSLKFFEKTNDEFKYKAVVMLKHIKVQRGEFLIKTGDFLEELYLIKRGILNIEIPTVYGKVKILEIYKNEHFGEVYMTLNIKSPVDLKVKSKNAEMYTLCKTDFIALNEEFPGIIKKIIKKSLLNTTRLELKAKKLFQRNEYENKEVYEKYEKEYTIINLENEKRFDVDVVVEEVKAEEDSNQDQSTKFYSVINTNKNASTNYLSNSRDNNNTFNNNIIDRLPTIKEEKESPDFKSQVDRNKSVRNSKNSHQMKTSGIALFSPNVTSRRSFLSSIKSPNKSFLTKNSEADVKKSSPNFTPESLIHMRRKTFTVNNVFHLPLINFTRKNSDERNRDRDNIEIKPELEHSPKYKNKFFSPDIVKRKMKNFKSNKFSTFNELCSIKKINEEKENNDNILIFSSYSDQENGSNKDINTIVIDQIKDTQLETMRRINNVNDEEPTYPGRSSSKSPTQINISYNINIQNNVNLNDMNAIERINMLQNKRLSQKANKNETVKNCFDTFMEKESETFRKKILIEKSDEENEDVSPKNDSKEHKYILLEKLNTEEDNNNKAKLSSNNTENFPRIRRKSITHEPKATKFNIQEEINNNKLVTNKLLNNNNPDAKSVDNSIFATKRVSQGTVFNKRRKSQINFGSNKTLNALKTASKKDLRKLSSNYFNEIFTNMKKDAFILKDPKNFFSKNLPDMLDKTVNETILTQLEKLSNIFEDILIYFTEHRN